MAIEQPTLPADVRLIQLKSHPDHRGELTEVFRNEWHRSPLPVQWLVCESAANALRGIHAHERHWNYLCALGGELLVGLHDLRPETPAARRSVMLRLGGGHLQMLVIPPGVAHGVYSPADSVALLGSSGHDDSPGHHRCRWDSPELGLQWPCTTPDLSAVDRGAGTYGALRQAVLSAGSLRAGA